MLQTRESGIFSYGPATICSLFCCANQPLHVLSTRAVVILYLHEDGLLTHPFLSSCFQLRSSSLTSNYACCSSFRVFFSSFDSSRTIHSAKRVLWILIF
jgi:hypothetical protein